MITLLMGENSYEINSTLQQLVARFDGVAERFDGADLDVRQLPDLLMGMSLFSQERLVVIRNLSENKMVWDTLPDWLERLSDDISLVLVEAKPDKRTKTYKALKKVAEVREFMPWTDRGGVVRAEEWVAEQVKERHIAITPALVRLLVARVGADQWQLAYALDKLSVLDEITEERLKDVIDAKPQESVFELFEAALKGDTGRLGQMITTLSLSEEPYQLFGLLSGQAFQLAALAVAQDDSNVTRDLSVHPFVLSKLRPYARQYGVRGASAIVAAFASADEAMKTSVIDPWIVIEQTLFTVTQKPSS